MNLPTTMTNRASGSAPATLIGVVADPAEDAVVHGRALNIAAELGIPLLATLPEEKNQKRMSTDNRLGLSPDPSLALRANPHRQAASDQEPAMVIGVTSDRVEIRVLRGEEGLRGGNPVAVNLLTIDVSSPFGRSLQQPLAKAIGRKRYADPAPSVLDVTAGLGEDSWVLAAFGCQVTSIERSKVISVLLRDGLERARLVKPEIADRIKLVFADGIATLRSLATASASERPDIVFLDPMFPTGRKSREQKSMRVVRCLVGDDMDAGELVELARKVARKRVVIKRPLHAPGLEAAGMGRPDVVHEGKSLRFDVFVAGMNTAPDRA